MDWTASPTVVALIALTGMIWQARRRRADARDRLARDLELLSNMPAELQNRERFREHIDQSIAKLLDVEDKRTRDWQGALVAFLLLILLGRVLWDGVQDGGWGYEPGEASLREWGDLLLGRPGRLGAALKVMFGFVGSLLAAWVLAACLVPRLRDERGIPIRTPADPYAWLDGPRARARY